MRPWLEPGLREVRGIQGWWTPAKLTIEGPFLFGPTSEAIRSKAHESGLRADI